MKANSKHLLFLIPLFIIGCSHQRHINNTAEVRQFFELDVQLQNVELHYYYDGGTTGLELTDVYGNQSAICIDCEAFGIGIPESKQTSPETIDRIRKLREKCLYVGATHPDIDGAEEIECHSDMEARILERVKEFMLNNPQYDTEFSRLMDSVETERNISIEYL